MNGYVLNKTNAWVHAMKRAIKPGGKITLQELYNEYGVKNNLKDGEDFISWLRNVKLKDPNKWKIVHVDEETEEAVSVESIGQRNVTDVREDDRIEQEGKQEPLNPNKYEVDDITNLSVRKGREIIPKINDINLLRYALKQANQLAGKDSLCNILRKRVKDLEVTR